MSNPKDILSALQGILQQGDNSTESKFLVKYILESLASDQDTKIQNQLFKNLVLDYSKLNRKLEQKIEEVIHLSQIDPLTGIFNRLKFNESIKHQYEMAKRYNNFFSIIMMDIDHFKKINDIHGHDVGDEAIVSLTNNTRNCLRKADIFSRWGGEEFIILAPQTRIDDAEKIAERIREKIEKQQTDSIPSFTISAGVTQFQESDTIETVLKRVDQLLYEAKKDGRNQVKSDQ